MTFKKLARKIALPAAALMTLGLGVQACLPGTTLDDTLANAFGVQVLGVQPASSSSYQSDGTIAFNVLAQDTNTNSFYTGQTDLKGRGLDVTVENDDGSMSPCEHVATDFEESSEFNTLSMLIDDSGSMGLTFPEEEFGDLCVTCPHDPDKMRGRAAETLARKLLEAAPQSRIALMHFGPTEDIAEGMLATGILTDFTSDSSQISQGLTGISGDVEAGTPLWDSLADVIGVTDTEGDEYEGVLRTNNTVDSKGNEAEVKKLVLVLSDGDDRDSTQYDLAQVIELANAQNVTVYAIGLGPASSNNSDPRLQEVADATIITNLQKLAEQTGGYYASVHDAGALEQMYTRIAESLTSGYQVEEYSCKPKPTASSPDSEARVPQSGEKVSGEITVDGERQRWEMVAP